MTVPLPRYTHAIIATCATCGGDLEPDGPCWFWCRSCRMTFSFTQVIPIDETDYDRD